MHVHVGISSGSKSMYAAFCLHVIGLSCRGAALELSSGPKCRYAKFCLHSTGDFGKGGSLSLGPRSESDHTFLVVDS